jgi:hypothetical protein
MKISKIWRILKRFKDSCKFRGWKISENEDWIEVEDKYHNFLLARNVHPSSFKSILTNRKCIIREGLSYRVVEASYTAWLLSEAPLKTLVKEISENPDFHDKIALYDLSPLFEGKNFCIRLNYTDSPVFQEFENFLKNKLKVKLKTIPNPDSKRKDYAVLEVV